VSTRPRLGARTALLVTAGLLVALAATNRWLSWNSGAQLVSARDEFDYRRIALAAPKLPSLAMANQHAQVFAPNYLVGLLHAVVGGNVDLLFRVVSLVVIVATCLGVAAALRSTGLRAPLFTLCLALFVLNTYSLRYYLIVPGYVTDLTFVLSLVLLSVAVISERFWLILGAIVVATLVRQTALPVTLALAYIVAFSGEWRLATGRLRAARAVAVVGVPVAVFGLMLLISSSFSVSATPGLSHLTVLDDLGRLPSGAGSLVQHVVRVVNPLLGVGAALAVALLLRARMRPGDALGWRVRACLLLGASVWLQAMALSPGYSAHPERLAVLSLIPFIFALALILRDLQDAGISLTPPQAAGIVAIVLAGSLHYLYTWLGPATALQGGVLQLLAALAVAAVVWRAGRAGGTGANPGPVPTS
jgi:hypothetical protein